MKKWGKVWKIPIKELTEAIKNSSSFSEAARKLDIPKGGGIRSIKDRLVLEHVDFSHIPEGKNSNTGRSVRQPTPSDKFTLDKVMVKNSTYSRGCLKRRLLKKGLLKNKCAICDLDPEWNNKP